MGGAMTTIRVLGGGAASLMLALGSGWGHGAMAQAESFLWGPGSNVGPSTTVEPKNCVRGADGSISCHTKLVNPPGDTPAKPQYEPFKN